MKKDCGIRCTKLKLIYKKAIQMTLDHKNNIIRLLQETVPVDSFFNSDASKSIIIKDDLSSTVSQKLHTLQNQLSELFKTKMEEYELPAKLNELDHIVNNNLSTSRDIQDPLYIKEIYESHIAEDKSSLVDFIKGEIATSKQLQEELCEETSRLEQEIESIKKNNLELENRLENLTNNISNILDK
ncbi:hypothetical protein NGRA_0306 [Nosema granulosis]|uniref:Uncharacterized protein n=1 Tax=Nosema granulosis TaxID=83296 RepID=A0A9P6H144_9MICR|nr:hypothetical protein NGRA_0306 [Nosema granulosis]